MTGSDARYPSLAEYALIGDCHTAALVSRSGSIDWCCLPRFDSPSAFARLLDWDRGGHWILTTTGARARTTRRYLPGTLVLESTIETDEGRARLLDCLLRREDGGLPSDVSHPVVLRVVEGLDGQVPFRTRVAARFDYGHVRPWVRLHGDRCASVIGADQGLVVTGDLEMEATEEHDLVAEVTVEQGQRARLAARFHRPEHLDPEPSSVPVAEELDRRLEQTIGWWQEWSAGNEASGESGAPLERPSAVVLKTLTHEPTGAIAASVTTSLPEALDGDRNWDYRYSWVRDSSFTIRSLVRLGHDREAEGFRRFIERSAAGSAEELQIAYGLGGESRLIERVLADLEGWRGVAPVRIGNGAHEQLQLDVYGELLDLAWRWAELGHQPDEPYWQFLVGIAKFVVDHWDQPDRGMWEVRAAPRHYVHSKVMCWAALNRVLELARGRGAEPPSAWAQTRDEIRNAVESDGYDADGGTFVASFGDSHLDAALLRLPTVGFVDWCDDRMVRTTDAIADRLALDGLLRRYDYDDGMSGSDSPFIACAFWLAEAYARQGRLRLATRTHARACATANDVGLMAEEYDPRSGEPRGNVPMALTHLSHIAAGLAIRDAEHGEVGGREDG